MGGARRQLLEFYILLSAGVGVLGSTGTVLTWKMVPFRSSVCGLQELLLLGRKRQKSLLCRVVLWTSQDRSASSASPLPYQTLGKSLVPILFMNACIGSASQLSLFSLDRCKQWGSRYFSRQCADAQQYKFLMYPLLSFVVPTSWFLNVSAQIVQLENMPAASTHTSPNRSYWVF